jgi:hypothetical protein
MIVMKMHFKLLSTSLIFALSFASSQAIYGMEKDDQENNGSTISQKKEILWKDSNVGDFSKLPAVLKQILKYVFLEIDKKEGFGKTYHNLSLVSKNFKVIVEKNVEKWICGIPNLSTENEEVFWSLVKKGKLIHTDSKTQKKTVLPISALPHPLKGEFDLSNCGDTGKYLSINMGYRKEINPKNANKAEIWVAPRFLIEKELNASASHFQPIMDEWKQERAPVGIFFNFANWNNLGYFDYVITGTLEEMKNKNLLEKWQEARPLPNWRLVWGAGNSAHYRFCL